MGTNYGSVHLPGGATVRVGDSVGSLVNMGVLDGDTSVEVTYDLVEYVGSQGESVIKYVKNMAASMSANLVQLYLPNIAEILDGVATVSSVAGTLVSGATQTIAAGWTANKMVRIEGQNSDGSAPTINSVTASTSGLGAEDDDYVLVQGADGFWYIALRTDGTATFATSESVVVDYDYTPAESKTLKMGSKSAEITPKIVEVELTQDGKIFRARLWSAANESGLTLAFPSSAGDNPATIPITLTGGLDTSRSDGDQLIEIYDEIGLTV
jgi:hypothetical protein